MDAPSKIIPLDQLPVWRNQVRRAGKQLAVTNGCFDLLHAGHVLYLEAARREADLLLIGLNGDDAVRQLKGPGRPVNPEQDRAIVLAGLQSVDAVTIFPEFDAARFLALAQPDVYIKGGDYTLETLNQEERRVVEAAGGRILLVPLVPGKSTSSIVRRMNAG
jgi:D-glycero-beta-D-manno-heptose 1-phosphate adenylyltransferase